jgi:hypothetical protein
LKVTITTILSLLLLLPSIGTLVLFTQFKINQDQIAQTICIQRANVNNSCNGRCELQKSLKKFEDNERQIDHSKLKEKSELVYTTIQLQTNIDSPIYMYAKKNSYSYAVKKPMAFTPTLFRPPLA